MHFIQLILVFPWRRHGHILPGSHPFHSNKWLLPIGWNQSEHSYFYSFLYLLGCEGKWKNSAFIWMRYPECYPQRVCSANFVAFPHVAQLSFHKNITSVPLSFHLHPSVQGFLWIYCYYSLQCCSISSQQVFCAQHTLLSLCSHGPVPSCQLSWYLWGLVCHPVL